MICIFIVVFISILSKLSHGQLLDPNPYKSDVADTDRQIGLTTAELFRLRGFEATNHYYTTSEGYILNIVKATNPETPPERRGRKRPLLFLHGLGTTSTSFLVNSARAKPRDLSDYDPSNMTLEQLEQLVGPDPAFRSLPLSALIFGHEVWMYNRRGTRESFGHIDPTRQPFDPTETGTFDVQSLVNQGLETLDNLKNTFLLPLGFLGPNPVVSSLDILTNPALYINYTSVTYNPRYWNYSLDEEIDKDMPEVIDYVLEQTGHDKLNIVGHSLGCTLIMLALSVHPELSDKLSHVVLWAPAVDLPETRLVYAKIFAPFERELIFYNGPIPPPALSGLIKQIVGVACQPGPSQALVCKPFAESIFGDGGDQQDLSPGIATTFFDTVSAHEVVSYIQSVKKGRLHFFDYRNKRQNLAAYGQEEPPVYDLSKIRSKNLSFYGGNTDIVVTPGDYKRLLDRLSVPYESTLLNQTGVLFNHASFVTHKDLAKLVILPSMMTIAS